MSGMLNKDSTECQQTQQTPLSTAASVCVGKHFRGLDDTFSTVKYKDIAPFVGLDPEKIFSDAELFDLRRSRIPTDLFKDIVMDMDRLMLQYGPVSSHTTEEARSRFLSPILNHLVVPFGSSFRNTPESLMTGRITRKGRIEYHLRTFGIITVVFMEVNLKISNDQARLKAIAQVIAECDACDNTNSESGFNVPIYGILCDGSNIQFFTFDGSTKPYKFSIGVAPGSHPLRQVMAGFQLRFLSPLTAHPSIHHLRPICEVIFNLLLVAFIASLKARRAKSQSGQQESLHYWDKALQFAEEALENSEHAEVLRQGNSIVNADANTEAAFKALRLSTDAVLTAKGGVTPRLMDGWDDHEVAKV